MNYYDLSTREQRSSPAKRIKKEPTQEVQPQQLLLCRRISSVPAVSGINCWLAPNNLPMRSFLINSRGTSPVGWAVWGPPESKLGPHPLWKFARTGPLQGFEASGGKQRPHDVWTCVVGGGNHAGRPSSRVIQSRPSELS